MEAQGNAKKFQCAYHGWMFSNTGELLTVTFADGYGPNFDKAAHNLGRFPRVESYRGYVFGSLNPDVEPLLEWMGPAQEMLDWSIDKLNTAGARVVKSSTMVFSANWKLQNDNNGDMYHVPFTHRSVGQMTNERHGSGKGARSFPRRQYADVRQVLRPRTQADRSAAVDSLGMGSRASGAGSRDLCHGVGRAHGSRKGARVPRHDRARPASTSSSIRTCWSLAPDRSMSTNRLPSTRPSSTRTASCWTMRRRK
jgi:phenylpropionate dioxygenase-like ring-hydroxylating dioxygenase large terminal subunit